MTMAVPEPATLGLIPDLSPVRGWDTELARDIDSFAVTISPADLLHIYPSGAVLSRLVVHLTSKTLMRSRTGSTLRLAI